jgi:hypothetical protein
VHSFTETLAPCDLLLHDAQQVGVFDLERLVPLGEGFVDFARLA